MNDSIEFIYGSDDEKPLIKNFKIIGTVIFVGLGPLLRGSRSGTGTSILGSQHSDLLFWIGCAIFFTGTFILFYSFIIYNPFQKIGSIIFSNSEISFSDAIGKVEKVIQREDVTRIEIVERITKALSFQSYNLFEITIYSEEDSSLYICQTYSKGNIEFLKNLLGLSQT